MEDRRTKGRDAPESEARFRPKIANLHRETDYWFWADNPFSGTPS
jgi:hypothetical protein